MARIDDPNAGGHEHDAELDMEHDHEHDHDDLQACIEECLNCHIACTTTAQYCLAQGGRHADADLVGLLLDCAELCQTSANFMLRGSPYHPITCLACAEVCRGCEEACRAFDDDEQMRLCADACASCADHCERMAATDDDEEDDEA